MDLALMLPTASGCGVQIPAGGREMIKSVIRKHEVHGPGHSLLAFPHILLIVGLLFSPSTTNADVPSAPFLYLPPNGSSVCNTTPYFEWSSVSGVDFYYIEVGNNSNFSSLEIEDRTPNPYYTPGTPLSPGTYYLLSHPDRRQLQLQFARERRHDLEPLLHARSTTIARHSLLARAGLQPL
jgi:hypothetical protein